MNHWIGCIIRLEELRNPTNNMSYFSGLPSWSSNRVFANTSEERWWQWPVSFAARLVHTVLWVHCTALDIGAGWRHLWAGGPKRASRRAGWSNVCGGPDRWACNLWAWATIALLSISLETPCCWDLVVPLLNPLKATGYYTYHLLYHTKTLHSVDRVYLCVPYGSHNKHRLFP
jgi:hypothetical protein